MSDNGGTILALDLALATGWALGGPSGPPRYGLWRLSPESDLGRRNSTLARFLEDFLAISRPSLILFEAPVAKMQSSARALIYLAGVVEMIAYEQSVPCREELPQTARKLVLGRGSFFARDRAGKTIRRANGKMISESKDAVMSWARGNGWDPATHDVADALVLLRYGLLMQRSRVMAGAGS